MKEEYFKELIKLAEKAKKKKEVPIAAIIVKNNKIISKGYNRRVNKYSVLNHAEIIAILKANKKMKDWRLFDCDLYVTLKPCSMCENIIRQSRIRNVFYLVDKLENKKEYNKTAITKTNISSQERLYTNYLKEFFQKKRDKK